MCNDYMDKAKMRVFWSIVSRFDKVSERLSDLFFEERPWLLHPTETVKVMNPDGSSHNEIHISPHNFIDKSEERKVLEKELDILAGKIHDIVMDMSGEKDKQIEDIFGAKINY